MPRCHACNTEYDATAERCPDCGNSSPEEVRCTRCGERFAGGDACPFCGRARDGLSCELHPETPAVGRCVLCGRALCRACRKGRGALRCADHADVRVIQGWGQVYSTTREFEAQLLRENLEAEGIDAQIFSQKDQMLPVDLGELSIVRLLVPAWQYESARRVIRRHMDAEGEVTFACSSCGVAYEEGAGECAACGARLS